MTVKRGNGSGLGVDSRGGPVVDPTANVIALNAAQARRQDDLREADLRRIDDLRAAEVRRIDDLNEAESRRVDELMSLRDGYNERLSLAEAKRIDAIRAVDVNAVAVERQRSSDQASVLASQVAQSADALRSLVASTAATVASQLQQLQQALDTRVKSLEQSQYKGEGSKSVTDPAIAQMSANVEKLLSVKDTTGGERRSSERMMSTGINVVLAIIALAALFLKSKGLTP